MKLIDVLFDTAMCASVLVNVEGATISGSATTLIDVLNEDILLRDVEGITTGKDNDFTINVSDERAIDTLDNMHACNLDAEPCENCDNNGENLCCGCRHHYKAGSSGFVHFQCFFEHR